MDTGKQPASRVVGFKVEGIQPSPDTGHALLNERKSIGAGSPTPVIIPPSLQPRESSSLSGASRATPGPGEGAAAKDGAAGSGAPGAAGAPPPPPAVIIPPAPAAPSAAAPYPAATTSTHSTASFPIPPAPPATATTPTLTPTAASQPKAILQSERAEAAHIGLQRQASPSAESDTETVTSGVSTRVAPSPPQKPPKQQQQQATQQQPATAAKKAAAAAPSTPTPTPAGPPAPVHALGGGAGAGGPGASGAPQKKSQKEMTRAERRELQEQQKAAKAAAQAASGKGGGGGGGGLKKEGSVAGAPQGGAKGVEGRPSNRSIPGGMAPTDRVARLDSAISTGGGSIDTPTHQPSAAVAGLHTKPKKQQGAKVVSLNPTEMFTHLQQFKKVTMETLLEYKDAASMPPEVLQLGLRYADGTITGASARCMAMLHVFCQVIQNYSTPANARLNRDLTSYLNTIIDFLVKCRPLALSMGNAIKWLKMRIASIPPDKPESQAKEDLVDEIREFVRSRIEQAQVLVANLAAEKVEDGDVIMTYAYSHIVAKVLLEALRPSPAATAQGSNGPRTPKRFRVIVVDSRPEQEGLLMLQKLQAAGIACTYAHMNALSFVMQDVTKVFLGASAVMSNGTVMSRAGTAAVAMMARAQSKPILVCCESYKFHERVQLDAITHNELGDPDVLSTVEGRPDVTALKNWQNIPRLALLNLKYDAMPAQYVTAIVTEHALIPPTSVPVVIREYMAMHRE